MSSWRRYFVDKAATYRAPDEITFSQVFFNPDTRKDATVEDAKAELERLIAAGEPDPETLEAGDRLMLKSTSRPSPKPRSAARWAPGLPRR